MRNKKEKLMIIDGNALIHRSFHALPPTLRTQSGQLVNAVYGFTSFLLKSLEEFKPEYVVLTLDKAGPTFRHKEYSNYKATRVKAADELYQQIPLVKKVAKAFNIPIFEKSAYEADDLIGTICYQTKTKKNLEIIIITGDMDVLQLVDDQTKVYTMSRGLSDSVLYDINKVKERYNIYPKQVIDYKALRGDPSDNIPGVKGVGDKTAVDLLIKFNDLENIYKAVDENDKGIKEKTLKLLLDSQDNAFLSQKLATIDCHAPIKFDLSKALFSSFSTDLVLKLFSELNFRSLINKLHKLYPRDKNDKDGNTAKKKSYHLINTEQEFNEFIKQLQTKKSFSLKIKASDNNYQTKLLGIGFSWKNNEAYFVKYKTSWLKKLKKILENKKIKKYGHHLKLDWKVLQNYNITLQNISFDTIIASYLLHPNNRHHDLDYIIFTELNAEREKEEKSSQQLSLDSLGLDDRKIGLSICEDVDFIIRLVPILKKELKKQKLYTIFNTIELPLIKVLGQMENTGIKFNIKPIESLSSKIQSKLNVLEEKIYKLATTEFNINSPKQLREILFETLKISTTNIKKTKTGFSTAEDELNKLTTTHEIIPLIQEYREFNKLQNTYLKPLPKMINPISKRIHTHFNQTITATGRLSSTNPNLQNIPARTKEGQEIRRAFVSSPGYTFISLDYSQIELRLAAHLSNDKKMIKAFKNNIDIHSATAAEINQVKLSEVNPQMRHEAKAINFGILYGQGPHGLSQSAKIPYWRSKQFIEQYLQSYPQIKKMINASIDQAREHGYALTMFGRKRPLPDINSNNIMVCKSAERMAINTPIQGSAADLIKLAMIEVQKLIDNNPEEIKLLLQVHDELIFEIKDDKLKNYSLKLKKIMENIIKLKIPILVDIHTGKNWGELK